MEPRTGKSKAALDAAAILHLKGEVDRVAILCPKVALEVWDHQIKLHYPFRAELEDHQYKWTRNGDRGSQRATEFYLLGYERAARRKRRGRRWHRPYLAELEAWGPDLLILDESHRLKRAGGVTSQGIWRMVQRLRKRKQAAGIRRPYVLLLTGTPTPKGLIDLFAQFRIVDESIFSGAKSNFEEKYVVYGHGKQKWRIVRYRHKRELMRKVRENSFSISQEEAGLAREQFNQTLTCHLPPEVRRKYDELAEFFITQVEGQVLTGANSGAVRTRLLQLTGGFTTEGDRLHSAKLDLLRSHLELVREQEEPVVVYCRFTPEVAAAVVVAGGLGYRAFPFEGATSSRDRRLALQALRSRKGAPACVVFQASTGSVALDLSSVAEVGFYSMPDGWESYWGDRNRFLGPAQIKPVRFTHLIAVGTLDRAVVRSLMKKEDMHGAMMRNTRRYLTGI